MSVESRLLYRPDCAHHFDQFDAPDLIQLVQLKCKYIHVRGTTIMHCGITYVLV